MFLPKIVIESLLDTSNNKLSWNGRSLHVMASHLVGSLNKFFFGQLKSKQVKLMNNLD